MMASRTSETTELPAPSAELVLVRTGAQAITRALGRKKGERFLREWVAFLQTAETVQALMPTRPRGERAAVAKAQREALAWLRAALPMLLDTMPPE